MKGGGKFDFMFQQSRGHRQMSNPWWFVSTNKCCSFVMLAIHGLTHESIMEKIHLKKLFF